MPIPLDVIIARTNQPRQPTQRRPVAPPPIKLAEIERRARLTPITSDPEIPRALVLITVTTTCLNCDHRWEHPNQNLLVRYDNHGLSNSVKYTKRDIEPFLNLPRERKQVSQYTPFCEHCF